MNKIILIAVLGIFAMSCTKKEIEYRDKEVIVTVHDTIKVEVDRNPMPTELKYYLDYPYFADPYKETIQEIQKGQNGFPKSDYSIYTYGKNCAFLDESLFPGGVYKYNRITVAMYKDGKMIKHYTFRLNSADDHYVVNSITSPNPNFFAKPQYVYDIVNH